MAVGFLIHEGILCRKPLPTIKAGKKFSKTENHEIDCTQLNVQFAVGIYLRSES